MLAIENLNVGYGDLQILWDISLDLKADEVVALVGANAVGKTTLINTISGLLTPISGDIKMSGNSILKNTSDERVKMGIVQVPEGRKLFMGMSVLENLKLGAFLRRDKEAVRKDMEWVLSLFPELEKKQSQLAGTLSGGEQQMVAIGRALMSSPKFLLIDEFSLGLAPVIVERLAKALEQIRKHWQMGILLVEQDVFLGLSMSERAVVLENGRVSLFGKSSDIIKSDKIREAYLGM